MMKETYRIQLQHLTCPNCADKIERAVAKLPGVEDVCLQFATGRLTVSAEAEQQDVVLHEVAQIVRRIEPEVTVAAADACCRTEETVCAHCHTHGESHGHAHDHAAESSRWAIGKIVLAALLFAAALWITQPTIKQILFLAAYLTVGAEVLWRALCNILHGEIFDENFLMALATVGAFCIGEYPEGVLVMLLYQLGELFQSYAVRRSRRSIRELMNIRPDHANRKCGDTVEQVAPEQVQVGEEILVKPGERVPLDGIVTEGVCTVDSSALTGESVPQTVTVGSEVLSGCIDTDGLITLRVTRPFASSAVSRILELVEHAGERKSNTERFITRFSRWYTPVVVGLALLVAVLPPLLLSQPFAPWIYKALVFLVMSCPCALVISVPLAFFAAIGAASRAGMLIKGANCLETIAGLRTVVFDKTGTLTEGAFALTELSPAAGSAEALLRDAAYAEHYAGHPIARAIRDAYDGGIDESLLQDVREIAGEGVCASVDGHFVCAGSARLLEQNRIPVPASDAETGTVVYVSEDGSYLGCLRISDTVRPDAAAAVRGLREAGIERMVMLTGDRQQTAQAVGEAVGIDDVRARLLPTDKVEQVEKLLTEAGPVAFVGDGINDAPVIMRADVGIAMGGLGSDAAIEAADVVLMHDSLTGICTLLRLARRTLRTAKENIVFSLGVKCAILLLSLFGAAGMWAAVFADVGVMILAVCNSLRMLHGTAGKQTEKEGNDHAA